MDKGLILKRFDGKLNRQFVESIIKEFEVIREKLYVDGNPTEVVSQYLNHQLHIIELKKQIKELTTNISVMEQRMVSIKNHSVDQLRKENRLLGWLDNLPTKELNDLKELVDIRLEFQQIDNKRFREKKMNTNDRVIIKM
ncbi:hypothetical protein N8147_00130 [Flavobacteriaceae bacterium]|nr:hypothetical protein [Flavobacteriaceae bacterium]